MGGDIMPGMPKPIVGCCDSITGLAVGAGVVGWSYKLSKSMFPVRLSGAKGRVAEGWEGAAATGCSSSVEKISTTGAGVLKAASRSLVAAWLRDKELRADGSWCMVSSSSRLGSVGKKLMLDFLLVEPNMSKPPASPLEMGSRQHQQWGSVRRQHVPVEGRMALTISEVQYTYSCS